MPPLESEAMGWSELSKAAEQRYGIVDLDEALRHVSDHEVRHAVQDRRLNPMFHGTYRFAGVPETWEQRVYAACLATGGVASHRTAARLWGISYVPAQRVELTVPTGQVVRLPSVRAHRSNLLPSSHVTNYAGVPITSGARTVFDLSAVLGDASLDRAINDGLRRGVTNVEELQACFDDLAGRGRRRVAHLRPLLEARQVGFDPGGSDREVELLRWFDEAGLPRPVQQLWVVAGGKRYCLDFGWPAAKMGLEYDGWDDHGQRLAFDYDRERRDELELAGWLILQVTSRHSRRKVVSWTRRGLEQRLPAEVRALAR
jgi:hypothetical protein